MSEDLSAVPFRDGVDLIRAANIARAQVGWLQTMDGLIERYEADYGERPFDRRLLTAGVAIVARLIAEQLAVLRNTTVEEVLSEHYRLVVGHFEGAAREQGAQ